MFKLIPLFLFISCASYHLAHDCNQKTCKHHKKSVKSAKNKKELRPRYQCKKAKPDGPCLWVKM